MQPKGIEVHQVLVRYFQYSPQIQENIEAKKLQDQLVFMNQSKKKAAVALQGLNKMSMEGTMKVAVTAQEGEAYKVKKEAEKDLYVRKKKADADLLVQLAKAQSTEMRNEAMQVVGVDKMVGKKMAEVLQGLEVVVLPSGGANDFNPLDLDSVLKIFGVSDTGESPGNAVQAPAMHTTQTEEVK
jgi:regulator of protease activity HflC (stomatin/prohibitin superfamily)